MNIACSKRKHRVLTRTAALMTAAVLLAGCGTAEPRPTLEQALMESAYVLESDALLLVDQPPADWPALEETIRTNGFALVVLTPSGERRPKKISADGSGETLSRTLTDVRISRVLAGDSVQPGMTLTVQESYAIEKTGDAAWGVFLDHRGTLPLLDGQAYAAVLVPHGEYYTIFPDCCFPTTDYVLIPEYARMYIDSWEVSMRRQILDAYQIGEEGVS